MSVVARGATTAREAPAAHASRAQQEAQRRRRQPSNRVQSLNRALDLLETLAGHGSAGLPLRAISKAVALNASTAHNLLGSLLFRGYVEQDPETGYYRLGAGVLTLAHQFLERSDLAQLAAPFLRRLQAEFDESVLLAVLRGGRQHTIFELQSSRPLVFNTLRGGGGGLHCTSLGKVLLSSLDPAEMEALLAAEGLPPSTPHTITDIVRLRHEVEQVRVAGYAIAHEEHYEGVIGVAAPVQDAAGRILAGVGVPFPTFRTSPAREAAITKGVRRTAAEISLRLGYQPAAEVLHHLAADAEAGGDAGASRAGSTGLDLGGSA